MSEEIRDPEAVLKALKTANEEAKANRQRIEELETQINEFSEFKNKAKTSAIKRELNTLGIANPDRISKLINLGEVDINEDGELANFEEQVEVVKTDWPELFSAKKRAESVDQFEDSKAEKKLSSSERQAQLILG